MEYSLESPFNVSTIPCANGGSGRDSGSRSLSGDSSVTSSSVRRRRSLSTCSVVSLQTTSVPCTAPFSSRTAL